MAQEQYTNLPYMASNENMVNAPNMKSMVEETKKHRAMYPDIHYKLEPFITSTCDAIEATGMMPSQDELDDITDGIFDDFCKTYPDMENYMKSNENTNDMTEAVQTQVLFGGRPRRFGGFRRRGLGRDLISALLLARLFGSRRSPFFPPFYFF